MQIASYRCNNWGRSCSTTHSNASFSVTVTDMTQRLYFLVHASIPALGSELIEITPQPNGGNDCRVTAFVVFEDKGHTVYLAAAVHAAGETVICHASFTHRALLKPQEEGLPLEAVLKGTLLGRMPFACHSRLTGM